MTVEIVSVVCQVLGQTREREKCDTLFVINDENEINRRLRGINYYQNTSGILECINNSTSSFSNNF